MAKHAPQLPIEVDSETGVWTTDALPMLYVPRHFFVNNHMGIEEVLGADAYAEILGDKHPKALGGRFQEISFNTFVARALARACVGGASARSVAPP